MIDQYDRDDIVDNIRQAFNKIKPIDRSENLRISELIITIYKDETAYLIVSYMKSGKY